MFRILSGIALALSATMAQAIITQPGTDVEFTYDETTLFGLGTVAGNSIFFSPTNFTALSENLDGSVSALETLNIVVKATTPGYEITEFVVAEKGDYKLIGENSSASAEGRLQLTTESGKVCGFFGCEASQIFSAGPLTTVGALTEWTATAGIDLGDTAGWGSDTAVKVQLQNDLFATSTVNGESALVQKKFEGVGLVINPIPVPAAAWLFGSALGLLGWMRRRAA